MHSINKLRETKCYFFSIIFMELDMYEHAITQKAFLLKFVGRKIWCDKNLLEEFHATQQLYGSLSVGHNRKNLK